MLELFKLIGIFSIKGVDKAQKELQDVSGEGEKAQSKLSKAFSAIGSAAVKLGKVAAVGISAAVIALSVLTKQAVSSYGEYEQLVGGVETLFKDSANKVQEYADKAYITSGLSANAYMKQATSFAASLIQSLDGDTSKAADYANRAIIDMSDNANKMGTAMESIQNAYNGFAKQNYTMLDNLKLGYGGTKEEMQRLIKDASKLKDVQAELGVTVDGTSLSFGNIVNAISVVQKQLGITGTTSLEAADTIQGSVGSMKAAWENLVAGLSKDNADLNDLIDKFVASATTSFGNLIPRMSKVLNGIVRLVAGFIPVISEQLPGLLQELLPPLIEGAANLLIGLAAQLPSLIQVIIDEIPDLLETIGGALADAFPDLYDTVKEALQGLVDKFKDLNNWAEDNKTTLELVGVAIGTVTAAIIAYNGAAIIKKALDIAETVQLAALIAADYAHAVASGVATAATTAFGTAVSFLTSPITLVILAIGALIGAGVLLYQNWDTIKEKMSELAAKFGEVWENIKQAVSSAWETITSVITVAVMFIGEILSAAFTIITLPFQFIWENCKEYIIASWEYISGVVSEKLNAISEFIQGVWNAIYSFLEPILTTISTFISDTWNSIKEAVSGALTTISGVVSSVWNVIRGTITSILTSIWNTISSIWNSIGITVSTAVNSVKTSISDGISAAYSTVSGILQNISDKFSSIFETVKTTVSNAIEKIKGYFNFTWKLPDIKLPHFKIEGEFSLKPPSVPHFGVDWYAKAMDNPMLLDKPTIFGYNQATGQALGAGEAGSEVVSGAATLMQMIQSAVGTNNELLIEVLYKILDAILTLDENMGGNMREAFENMSFSVNKREIARLIKGVE